MGKTNLTNEQVELVKMYLGKLDMMSEGLKSFSNDAVSNKLKELKSYLNVLLLGDVVDTIVETSVEEPLENKVEESTLEVDQESCSDDNLSEPFEEAELQKEVNNIFA